MKKLVLSTCLLLGGLGSANAQLANGSIAPDFTVTAYQSWLSTAGMNGNGTYNLYDYLDAGYTVVLDVSATWCGPCWNYHLSGALDELYIDHGPAGHPGVSPTTTDDVMVIWIEGDGATADATMLDGSGTPGNWIEPNATLGQIQFPMANPASGAANTINNNFNIGYFPTVYVICPNRVVTLVDQSTTALNNALTACPAPASQPADAAMLGFNGETEICPGNYTPIVQIQNNGTTNMTAATVDVKLGGNTVSTGTFAGNLAPYGVANVTCTPIASFAGGTLTATVTTVGDADATNGSKNKTVTVNNNPPTAASHIIKIDVTTDRYASETTWELTNSAGTVVASGGPWSNLSANGTTVRPTVTVNSLNPSECYKFTIYDAYGDGICCAYGNGAYSVKDNGGAVLLSGGEFTTEDGGLIRTGVLNVEELDLLGFNVFPNPATDVVNVTFEATNADYEISIIDLQGRVMSTSAYSNLAGTQSIAIATGDFAAGTYLVKVASNGRSQVSNIVIR